MANKLLAVFVIIVVIAIVAAVILLLPNSNNSNALATPAAQYVNSTTPYVPNIYNSTNPLAIYGFASPALGTPSADFSASLNQSLQAGSVFTFNSSNATIYVNILEYNSSSRAHSVYDKLSYQYLSLTAQNVSLNLPNSTMVFNQSNTTSIGGGNVYQANGAFKKGNDVVFLLFLGNSNQTNQTYIKELDTLVNYTYSRT